MSDRPARGWFSPTPTGAQIVVRAVPNASRDLIEGVVSLADDTEALKIRCAAPADKGRANDAIVALLASTCGLPRSAFTLMSGSSSRNKRIALISDAGAIGQHMHPHLHKTDQRDTPQ